jgi:hypothetical protein
LVKSNLHFADYDQTDLDGLVTRLFPILLILVVDEMYRYLPSTLIQTYFIIMHLLTKTTCKVERKNPG